MEYSSRSTLLFGGIVMLCYSYAQIIGLSAIESVRLITAKNIGVIEHLDYIEKWLLRLDSNQQPSG